MKGTRRILRRIRSWNEGHQISQGWSYFLAVNSHDSQIPKNKKESLTCGISVAGFPWNWSPFSHLYTSLSSPLKLGWFPVEDPRRRRDWRQRRRSDASATGAHELRQSCQTARLSSSKEEFRRKIYPPLSFFSPSSAFDPLRGISHVRNNFSPNILA